jgi:adenylosuccinate synthase
MIIRPFPIRVGNDGDNSSGGWYSDHAETTWDRVTEQAGMPDKERTATLAREHTTVTKRLRRVATFSWEGLERAVAICAPTYFVLNFAQYIDFDVHKMRTWSLVPGRVREFISQIERRTNVPVKLIGTGEDLQDIVDISNGQT